MENQPAQEFLVTYFDADCGRISSERFGSLKDAERFASRNCGTEESWAVIDAVAIEQARIAA
ncbi:hypothetical protein ACVWY0_003113 [Arthrobacter sp. UYNi723]